MGKGFPLEKAPPSEIPYLFIFATGTGVGPIKALIESDALKVQLTTCHQGSPLHEHIECAVCLVCGPQPPRCAFLLPEEHGPAAQARERQLTRLYYGTFNPDMTAYKALIPEWEASGVEVRLTPSSGPEALV